MYVANEADLETPHCPFGFPEDAYWAISLREPSEQFRARRIGAPHGTERLFDAEGVTVCVVDEDFVLHRFGLPKGEEVRQ
jgi:hypothetical protein